MYFFHKIFGVRKQVSKAQTIFEPRNASENFYARLLSNKDAESEGTFACI